MRITIIYDNDVYKEGLQADWGFSCLIEESRQGGTRILFDTGTNGSILLSNMEKLHIDPTTIDEVFISHAHFDHVGGLSTFLNVKSDVTIYAPPSLRGIRGAKEVVSVNEPLKIHENVFSTGEIDHIEQSMAIKIDEGIVIIAGCSHPRMEHILNAASQFGNIYAIIGGLHGFSEYDLFQDLQLICPTHCTQHKAEIQALYPEKYTVGGAGKIIVF
jgi:7,8-dihydropterin-6-yl-methyl-4-(beta-D-ribofuranosyl)aminobenzene 5'-phosphate synthase